MIDREIVGRLLKWKDDDLRVLVMPDHPTPLAVQTHTEEPVPFVMWGKGLTSNGAVRLSEAEAKGTGFFIQEAYNIIDKLLRS